MSPKRVEGVPVGEQQMLAAAVRAIDAYRGMGEVAKRVVEGLDRILVDEVTERIVQAAT